MSREAWSAKSVAAALSLAASARAPGTASPGEEREAGAGHGSPPPAPAYGPAAQEQRANRAVGQEQEQGGQVEPGRERNGLGVGEHADTRIGRQLQWLKRVPLLDDIDRMERVLRPVKPGRVRGAAANPVHSGMRDRLRAIRRLRELAEAVQHAPRLQQVILARRRGGGFLRLCGFFGGLAKLQRGQLKNFLHHLNE